MLGLFARTVLANVFEVTALSLSILTWMMVFVFDSYSANAFRLFTWWVMAMQLLYFFLAIALPIERSKAVILGYEELVEESPQVEAIRARRRVFLRELRHVGRILSVSMALIFWVIFFYDRELILPRNSDRVFGLNILQHLVPPLLFVKDNKEFHGKPKPYYSAFVAIFYSFVVLVWYLVDGTWPYRFMHDLTFRSYSMMTSLALTLIWVLHKLIIY